MPQEKLTYVKAAAEIEEIVEKMRNNEFELDELSEKVKRIAKLVNFCKDKLRQTESDVQEILDSIDSD